MNGTALQQGQDTIIALATPPGRSALAVVRISGPLSLAFLCRAVRNPIDWNARARQQILASIRDASKQLIDQALVTYFPAPHSYTGEDVVEISCHGSVWVCRRMVETALQAGIRLARPGEFTQRAFLSGKLDLVQAEAIRDLIASETGLQARVAREQLQGRLSQRLQPLKAELVRVISHLETAVEFIEDEVEPEQAGALLGRLKAVSKELDALERSFGLGKVVQAGLKVVVSGRPNVGKSSIFNALMQEERAIVTDIPGTTRDALSERIHIEGVPVELVDTAGIRETEDVIERMGLERTLQHLAESSIVLFVLDGAQDFGEEDWKVWEVVGETRPLLVINKLDLKQEVKVPGPVEEGCCGRVELSARERRGLDRLHEAIWEAAVGEGSRKEDAMLTDLRHLECVQDCRRALKRALEGLGGGLSEEYPLYDLRKALEALGRLTGEVSVEDILGEIFSTFCIGK